MKLTILLIMFIIGIKAVKTEQKMELGEQLLHYIDQLDAEEKGLGLSRRFLDTLGKGQLLAGRRDGYSAQLGPLRRRFLDTLGQGRMPVGRQANMVGAALAKDLAILVEMYPELETYEAPQDVNTAFDSLHEQSPSLGSLHEQSPSLGSLHEQSPSLRFQRISALNNDELAPYLVQTRAFDRFSSSSFGGLTKRDRRSSDRGEDMSLDSSKGQNLLHEPAKKSFDRISGFKTFKRDDSTRDAGDKRAFDRLSNGLSSFKRQNQKKKSLADKRAFDRAMHNSFNSFKRQPMKRNFDRLVSNFGALKRANMNRYFYQKLGQTKRIPFDRFMYSGLQKKASRSVQSGLGHFQLDSDTKRDFDHVSSSSFAGLDKKNEHFRAL